MVCASRRHAEMGNLAGSDEILRLLDRDLRIDAVLIEQIDASCLQPLQCGISDARMLAGRESRPATLPSLKPNLVAITTLSRNRAAASAGIREARPRDEGAR